MKNFLLNFQIILFQLKTKIKWLTFGFFGFGIMFTTSSYAINEAQTQNFARMMSTSANQKNIGQIAGLIDDEVVISITRQNKTITLDKNAYLQLLQKGWAESIGYHYTINLNDVVISGNQARAQVTTTETWTNKEGKKITLKTNARATLIESGNRAVLLRMVSQISVN